MRHELGGCEDGAGFYLRIRPTISGRRIEFEVADHHETVKLTAITTDLDSALSLCRSYVESLLRADPRAMIVTDIDPVLSA